MAATTIYTRSVSDLSLTVTLQDQLTERRQAFVDVLDLPLAGGPNLAARDYALSTAWKNASATSSPTDRRYTRLSPLVVDLPPRPLQVNRPDRGRMVALEGARKLTSP